MNCPLIPLGFHCNITYLQQALSIKHETSLFEWLESNKLQYITDIIRNIKTVIDTTIIKGYDKNIHILCNEVFTYHYNIDEYKIIFERRANRFLNIIKESTELLFVRINKYNNYTSEEEINNFINEIYSINSSVKIKFLIIHTVDENRNHKILDDSKIYNITFIQKEFLHKDCPDEYLIDNKIIQQQFLEYLQEIGMNIEIKSNIIFSDDS